MRTPASKLLSTSIRLRRGTVPRAVRVLIATPLDEPDRFPPRNVIDAFVAGVDAGLFGPGTVTERATTVQIHPEHGLCSDVLDARFSAISPAAFAAVPRMVRASVPAARHVEIHELHADERVLVVRALDSDTEATILDVDWEIALPSSEIPCLHVELGSAPPPAVAERLLALFRTWTDVVALGAFPPADGTPPAAVLSETRAEGNAVVARFGALRCGYGAFEAMFEALNRIHDEHPIARVSFADARR